MVLNALVDSFLSQSEKRGNERVKANQVATRLQHKQVIQKLNTASKNLKTKSKNLNPGLGAYHAIQRGN